MDFPGVLVDTSVWVDFVRGTRAAHVDALAELLESDISVGLTPGILQEVLQGAKTREHQAALERRFHAISKFSPADPISGAIAAARLYLDCRLAGKTPRSGNDCAIAAVAIEKDLLLFHRDRDFDIIARIEPRLRIYAYAT